MKMLGLFKLLGWILLIFLSIMHTNAIADEKEYSFAVVPQFDKRTTYEIWQPILDEVTKLSGIHFKLKGAITIPEFETQFLIGEFDFAYTNPYDALNAFKSNLYLPLVRDTGKMLYGIIVVRKDSDITDVRQLDNKTVAFPSPTSLGASLIPQADFKDLFKIEVNPIYVQSHSSVYLNVALNKADAGGGVQKTFLQQPENIQNALKIIYKTREFSPHPIVAHTRMAENIAASVKQAFLELGKTPYGKILLGKIPINKIGEAKVADYTPINSWGLDKLMTKEQ